MKATERLLTVRRFYIYNEEKSIMIKLEKKKSCIIWILMTVICTFFVCMIGSVSIEAKTVTKDITIGKGKTYAIEQTFSGKATFKTSNKKIAVIKNGKIIGKAIGKAKITIKDKGNTYIYKITVAKAYLNQNEIIINVGKTVNLKIKGMKGKVKWSSLNKKVATVKNGKVTGKKTGKTVIQAKINGTILKCNVKVEKPELSKKKVTIESGKSYILKVKGTSRKVVWTSSNRNVVTVKNGKITGKKPGNTTVIAKVNGSVLKCNIRVIATKKPHKDDTQNTEGTDDKKPDNNDGVETNTPKLSTTSITWKFGDGDDGTYLTLNNADCDDVIWNTSDEKIVRVYPEGNSAVIYNNLKGGKAIVTATYKGKTYSCNVVSYSLYRTNISCEEGTGFDYDESAKNMDELVNTENFLGVSLDWTWNRTDLVQKKTTPDGSYTHYIVEDSGTTEVTGISKDGFTKAVVTINSYGKYIDKKGTYDEKLTNEVYNLLKTEETRNTDISSSCYSMPKDQLVFLLSTADRWYNGEISDRKRVNLFRYTPFKDAMCSYSMYGDREYMFGDNSKIIEIDNAKNASDVVKGINTYMGSQNWARLLLYIKVHTDLNKKYVYMVTC
jgi:bacterial group 2 Ig-like protein